jgi:hypothetical protein
LKESLSFNSVDDLEVRRVVTSDSAAKFSFLVELRPNAGSDVGEVRKAIHSTVEISPDRFDLRDAEEEGVHETEDVESHLFGREGADTIAFELVGDDVCWTHQTCSTRPSKRAMSITETCL